MKAYLITILYSLMVAPTVFAQDVPWRALENKKHILSGYIGADYSSYYGLSYGHVLTFMKRPIVLGTEFTIPFGNTLLDDWRWRTSVQAEVVKHDNFSLTIKPAVILRRYESPLAKMYNTGVDLSLLYGYTKPTWGLVALAHYDRSISTHITHRLLKDDYPSIQDGWYSTPGGNFKFGARVNYTLKSLSCFLTVGKHYGQNFNDNPTLPFFFELSINTIL